MSDYQVTLVHRGTCGSRRPGRASGGEAALHARHKQNADAASAAFDHFLFTVDVSPCDPPPTPASDE